MRCRSVGWPPRARPGRSCRTPPPAALSIHDAAAFLLRGPHQSWAGAAAYSAALGTLAASSYGLLPVPFAPISVRTVSDSSGAAFQHLGNGADHAIEPGPFDG